MSSVKFGAVSPVESCERRQTNRYVIRIPVTFQASASAAADMCFGEILNLSPGGICFSTSKALVVGNAVSVFLKVPPEVIGKPSPEWRWSGQVVHVQLRDSCEDISHVGVRFIAYEPTHRASQSKAP